MSMSKEDPGARELRLNQIVTWHGRGMTALDGYGIPVHADGIVYTIAERIELLAGRPAEPRKPDIHEPCKCGPGEGCSQCTPPGCPCVGTDDEQDCPHA